MQISVKTIGFLKNYHPGDPELIVEPGITIESLLKQLEIPSNLVALVLVNDKQERKNYILQDADGVQFIAVLGGG